MKKICVLGLGYIGLPTAAMFATHGIQVVGVDINDRVLDILQNGEIHIHEPGLKTMVQAAFGSGNLKVNKEPELADAFIIAVPTPFMDEIADTQDGIQYKKADMRYVISATKAIQPYLRAGNLVILESTSPPRTTVDLVKPILEESGLEAGKDFFLAYSPERVLPGKILYELVNNARVVGGINQISGEKGRELYRSFVEGEILVSDATTAEMTKLMENTFRDVNIALANEFSRLAEKIGFNVWEAIELANQHPRVNILQPGPGVGGHCISVDPWFLVETAPDITSLIHTTRTVNDSQPKFVVRQTKQLLGGSQSKKIAVLGLAYKPNVDDFRESPAIEVLELLMHEGYRVKAFDPFIQNQNKNYLASSIQEAAQDADLLLVLVAHSQFKTMSPADITRMRKKQIFDACGCFEADRWKNTGFKLHVLGTMA
jgi:UDP-N-acetyl-D-mannosaminuronic acid dehydrogenase